MNVDDLLRRAIEQNVLVYDEEAKISCFTDRLLLLMCFHAAAGTGGTRFAVERFVSSNEVLIPGFPYEVDRGIRARYHNLGGGLRLDKFDVLLAVGPRSEVLLGAF